MNKFRKKVPQFQNYFQTWPKFQMSNEFKETIQFQFEAKYSSTANKRDQLRLFCKLKRGCNNFW